MVGSKFGPSRKNLKPRYLMLVFAKLSCFFFMLCVPLGSATTLLKLDIDQVAKEAELVFEGEVLTHEVRAEARTGLINTYVTFSILDVIKGDSQATTIELKFAGGTINGETTKVNGLTIPESGERGIYFVESTSENLINPLVGWSQGHFLIKEIDGESIIYTTSHKPVIDVQSVSSIPPSIKRPKSTLEGNSDVAAGVLVDKEEQIRRQRLKVNELKSEILEMIR